MKMKKLATMALASMLTLNSVMNVFAFGSKPDEAAQGRWTDTNNLTWTYWSGESIVIGSGPKFSDLHPEITDPEHFLKENIVYPGEEQMTLNSQGQPKSNYTEGTLPLLQEFVNSFDWIHSDEVTRLKAVHARIARGRNGNMNMKEADNSGITWGSFNVLNTKRGVCADYASEFERLCKYVGLECVNYSSAPNHVSNMVKINGQWITVDPYLELSLFSNSDTVPVDYELEYTRYTNQVKESEWFKDLMDLSEAQRKAEAGEITWQQYFELAYPDKTLAEIEEIIGMDIESYSKLWQE